MFKCQSQHVVTVQFSIFEDNKKIQGICRKCNSIINYPTLGIGRYSNVNASTFSEKKEKGYQCIPIFGHFLMSAREFDDLVCHLPLFISDQCTTYVSRVGTKRVAPSWFQLWGKPTGSSSYHRTRCPRSAMMYGKEMSEADK